MDNSNFTFTPESVSKFWDILNNSHNQNDIKIANDFLIELKKNYNQCLEISLQLFKSQSLDDKLISSLLIYQSLQENQKILSDDQIFTQIKSYLIDNILIPYTNEKEDKENDYVTMSKMSLIIERICYSMSIIILIGVCSYWPNAIDDMLTFGKTTLKHTYLISVIFANCNNELKSLLLPNKDVEIITNKFAEKKEEFRNFINTILINKNNIDEKLYNKTIDLAINLTSFQVNILNIPDLIKVILSEINIDNIESLSKLFCESINNSQNKKLEENIRYPNISQYDEIISKEELLSFSYIIDIIVNYIQKNMNKLDNYIIFNLGLIFSSITENFVYMFFKKDSLSQKIFSLFFFFITYKTRKISQLLFETISIMKKFIQESYKLSNYSEDEKIQFMNFLLKILFDITNKSVLKNITKNQSIFLGEECITINNTNEINNNVILNENEENDYDEYHEISINDYRKVAEEAFIDIFEIFALNYGKDGINYFFAEITKDILPLLQKPINELSEKNILSVEIIIFIVKHISNSFNINFLDRTPLNQFVLILIQSQIVLNKFILVNLLALLNESSNCLEYNKSLFCELMKFVLNQITFKMSNENEYSEEMLRLLSFILKLICQGYDEGLIPEIWDKVYQVFTYYYDKFNYYIAENFTRSLACLFLVYVNTDNNIPDEMKLEYYKKMAEPPIIRIIKIGEMMLDKNKDKGKERMIRYEIIKNIKIISIILKFCSEYNKPFIENIFGDAYNKIYQVLNTIITEYSKDDELIDGLMTTFMIVSKNITVESLNNIFKNFKELIINAYYLNNDNYQCIDILKNIFDLKIKTIKDKNSSNKEYFEIYKDFIQLVRRICSGIIESTKYKFELILSLSSLFASVFPQINEINKEDKVIISDTILLFIEALKSTREENLTSNIFFSFKSFIESPNYDLINEKYVEIIKSIFLSFEHINLRGTRGLGYFCCSCQKLNKIDFMKTIKNVLNTPDFDCFNSNHKLFIYNYIDHFSGSRLRIKFFLDNIIKIVQKKNDDSIDDILENFNKELTKELHQQEPVNYF